MAVVTTCSWLLWVIMVPTEDLPEQWSRGDLEPIRNFLIAEAMRGVWTPLPELPL